jgi:hypothetical protein
LERYFCISSTFKCSVMHIGLKQLSMNYYTGKWRKSCPVEMLDQIIILLSNTVEPNDCESISSHPTTERISH